MAVDPGVRQQMITMCVSEIQKRRDRIGKLQAELACAQVEDAAQAALSQADNAVLATAAVVDVMDATVLQGEITQLQAEIDSLQNYRQAIRQVT
jgi:uncharacterized small protein (DUF1192 family)